MQYSLTYNSSSLNTKKYTVSQEKMLLEWQEIQKAQTNPVHFRPLYDRYYEAIFQFVYRRTLDESLTGDLCADVFFKAIQKLNNYQFKGVPFSAWLFRIASNEVTQYFRNVQKNRVVSVETNALPELMEEMDGVDARNEQLRDKLLPCLQQLKAKDLELIELRFFEQRSFKEIADILNISEGSCKMRTYRILERLKKMMIATS